MTQPFQFGEFHVEPARNAIVKDEQETLLEKRMMAVLIHLVESAPETVTTADLLDTHWPNQIVEASTAHRVMTKIRNALGDSPKSPIYIETVPKKGYRAIAHITALVALSSSEKNTAIAVLPFENLSPEPVQSYFAEGLAEELLIELAGLSAENLVVRARTSSFSFRQSDEPLVNIAKELDVRYLVTGTVRKSGPRLRVSATLVDCFEDNIVWSGQFDGNENDLFEFQDEVTFKILKSLDIRLKHLKLEHPTASIAAYSDWCEGLHHFSSGRYERAKVALQNAVAQDHQFDQARILLGWCHFVDMQRQTTEVPGSWPDILRCQEELKSPHENTTLKAIIEFYYNLNFEAGVSLAYENLSNPHNQRTSFGAVIDMLTCLERYDYALKLAKRFIALDPLSFVGHYQIWALLTRQGKFGAAQTAMANISRAGIDTTYFDAHRFVVEGNVKAVHKLFETPHPWNTSTPWKEYLRLSVLFIAGAEEARTEAEKFCVESPDYQSPAIGYSIDALLGNHSLALDKIRTLLNNRHPFILSELRPWLNDRLAAPEFYESTALEGLRAEYGLDSRSLNALQIPPPPL